MAELLESIASGAIGFIEMPRGDRERAAELFEQLVVHYVTNPVDASLLRDLADDARR